MSDLIGIETLSNWFWSLVVVVAVVVFWFVANKGYHRWDKSGDNSERMIRHRRVARNLHTILKYGLMAFTVLAILGIHGVEVGPLATSLGIVGIVLGFALQTGLEDVVMSVHIVTDSFFRVGDVVVYQGVLGEVVSATPQTTKIRNLSDDSVVSISNRNLHEIEVCSRKAELLVPISYRTDPSAAECVLKRCCDVAPSLIEPICSCSYDSIDAFGENAAMHSLVLECNPLDRVDALAALRSLVIKELAAEGISLADNTTLRLERLEDEVLLEKGFERE